jgi:multidrug efflux pump subunit AcrA (membrane-fusion protein)
VGSKPAPDIAKLRIDRGLAPVKASRRRRWPWLVAIALMVGAGGAWYATQPHPASVQTTAVVTSYPSQQYVVLNATGYVVPQRKAAIASKATGRLEWLGVAEGSRVKAGEVIARLDNRDVTAQAQSADAAVTAARATSAKRSHRSSARRTFSRRASCRRQRSTPRKCGRIVRVRRSPMRRPRSPSPRPMRATRASRSTTR